MVSAATAFFLPAPALKALSRRPPCAALLRRIRTRPGSFARRLPAVVAVLALVACLAPQSPVWAAAAPAVPAHEQMKAQAPAPGHPLPVIVVRNGAEERSGRLHTRMTLHPADDQTTATQADLTATVMAAAIMAVEESRVHAVTVTLISQLAVAASDEAPLARAVLIPDGRGFDGRTPGPVWTLEAASRGLTAQELEYQRLRVELRRAGGQPGLAARERAQRDVLVKVDDHRLDEILAAVELLVEIDENHVERRARRLVKVAYHVRVG